MPRSPSRSPTGSVTNTCMSSAARATARPSSCNASSSTICSASGRRHWSLSTARARCCARFSSSNLFAPGQPLADRLIIIDPEDVEHSPALNMFDLKAARLGSYSQTVKEQIEASTIETLQLRLRRARGRTDQPAEHHLCLRHSADARRLPAPPSTRCANCSRTAPRPSTRARLPSTSASSIRTSQAYFENQFFTKTYSQTKQQIARRLYSVLQVPAFDRMFASKTNQPRHVRSHCRTARSS